MEARGAAPYNVVPNLNLNRENYCSDFAKKWAGTLIVQYNTARDDGIKQFENIAPSSYQYQMIRSCTERRCRTLDDFGEKNHS